jgi:hypothetical protein
MTGSFLRKEPADLPGFLIQQARSDRAPRAALQRTMLSVTSASLGVGLATHANLVWGASAASKVTPWLVAKCVALGMTVTLASFVAAEQLGEAFGSSETTSPTPSAAPPGAREPGRKPASPTPSELAARVQQPQALSPRPRALAPSTTAAAVEADAGRSSSTSLPSSSAFGFSAPAGSPAELAREVARLRSARASLVSRAPQTALRVLDRYALEFPAGALKAEAAALRIEALALLGDAAASRRLAEDFLTTFPASPLVDRVRVLSGITAQGELKP